VTVNYQRFLTISPPFDETEYGAISQAAFIVDTVEAFDRTKESILFLVGENTNTNPATARKLGVPFIGCASHRFNLAVQSYLDTYDEIITSINNLMKVLRSVKKAGKLRMNTLRSVKKAGKLRMNTPLEPVTRNVTRWSSTYSMVERFFRLKEHLIDLDIRLI
jgi:ribosomal protein S30